jgi:hypothetical protein
LLTFTSVYFSESGLFNELRPIQIKKIPLRHLRLCANGLEDFTHRSFLLVTRLPRAGLNPAAEKSMAQIVVFGKENANFLLASIPSERRRGLDRSAGSAPIRLDAEPIRHEAALLLHSPHAGIVLSQS